MEAPAPRSLRSKASLIFKRRKSSSASSPRVDSAPPSPALPSFPSNAPVALVALVAPVQPDKVQLQHDLASRAATSSSLVGRRSSQASTSEEHVQTEQIPNTKGLTTSDLDASNASEVAEDDVGEMESEEEYEETARIKRLSLSAFQLPSNDVSLSFAGFGDFTSGMGMFDDTASPTESNAGALLPARLGKILQQGSMNSMASASSTATSTLSDDASDDLAHRRLRQRSSSLLDFPAPPSTAAAVPPLPRRRDRSSSLAISGHEPAASVPSIRSFSTPTSHHGVPVWRLTASLGDGDPALSKLAGAVSANASTARAPPVGTTVELGQGGMSGLTTSASMNSLSSASSSISSGPFLAYRATAPRNADGSYTFTERSTSVGGPGGYSSNLSSTRVSAASSPSRERITTRAQHQPVIRGPSSSSSPLFPPPATLATRPNADSPAASLRSRHSPSRSRSASVSSQPRAVALGSPVLVSGGKGEEADTGMNGSRDGKGVYRASLAGLGLAGEWEMPLWHDPNLPVAPSCAVPVEPQQGVTLLLAAQASPVLVPPSQAPTPRRSSFSILRRRKSEVGLSTSPVVQAEVPPMPSAMHSDGRTRRPSESSSVDSVGKRRGKMSIFLPKRKDRSDVPPLPSPPAPLAPSTTMPAAVGRTPLSVVIPKSPSTPTQAKFRLPTLPPPPAAPQESQPYSPVTPSTISALSPLSSSSAAFPPSPASAISSNHSAGEPNYFARPPLSSNNSWTGSGSRAKCESPNYPTLGRGASYSSEFRTEPRVSPPIAPQLHPIPSIPSSATGTEDRAEEDFSSTLSKAAYAAMEFRRTSPTVGFPTDIRRPVAVLADEEDTYSRLPEGSEERSDEGEGEDEDEDDRPLGLVPGALRMQKSLRQRSVEKRAERKRLGSSVAAASLEGTEEGGSSIAHDPFEFDLGGSKSSVERQPFPSTGRQVAVPEERTANLAGHSMLPQTDASIVRRQNGVVRSPSQPLEQIISDSVLTIDGPSPPVSVLGSSTNSATAPGARYRVRSVPTPIDVAAATGRRDDKVTPPLSAGSFSRFQQQQSKALSPTGSTSSREKGIPIAKATSHEGTSRARTLSGNLRAVTSSSGPKRQLSLRQIYHPPPSSSSVAHPTSPVTAGPPTTQHRIFILDHTRNIIIGANALTRCGDIVGDARAKGVLDAPGPHGEVVGGTDKDGGYALWEIWRGLGVERPIRELELLADVIKSWSHDSSNILIIRRTPLWPSLSSHLRPQAPVPKSGWVNIEIKRGKWSKRWLELQDCTFTHYKSEKLKDPVFLCHLTSFEIFYLAPHAALQSKAPKPFAFAIKSVLPSAHYENHEEYCHFVAVKTEEERDRWLKNVMEARHVFVRQRARNMAPASTVPATTLAAHPPVSAVSSRSKSLPGHRAPPATLLTSTLEPRLPPASVALAGGALQAGRPNAQMWAAMGTAERQAWLKKAESSARENGQAFLKF